LPLVAIGGITPANVRAIRAAGADCVAVCAAVSGVDDVERAARELCEVG
jgi:thiamine-phosphate pyrophosphorylase